MQTPRHTTLRTTLAVIALLGASVAAPSLAQAGRDDPGASAIDAVARFHAACAAKDRDAIVACLDVKTMMFLEITGGKRGSKKQRQEFDQIWASQGPALTDAFVQRLLAAPIPETASKDPEHYRALCQAKAKKKQAAVVIREPGTAPVTYTVAKAADGTWKIVRIGG